MKKIISLLSVIIFLFLLTGCSSGNHSATIVATTKPVYDFTLKLCQDTDICVERLITENVSCLHDYTLQVRQMRAIESAQIVITSGAGLESFLHDALHNVHKIVDASDGVHLLCQKHSDESTDEHHHNDSDPHIWLSTENARLMVFNIYSGLSKEFPQYQDIFNKNLKQLQDDFDKLDAYGNENLKELSSRNIITFHDGFGYFADQWDLKILKALEEEAGSEASAGELIELIDLIRQNNIPAIFTEENGSTSAAYIISLETGIPIYSLSMGMSEQDYFDVMYHNINTIKEALE